MLIHVCSDFKSFKYSANVIPKVDEFLYFPHFGTYKIKKIIYNISDDSNNNKIMFVEVIADKVS